MSNNGGLTKLDGIEQMRGLAALGVVVAHAVDTASYLGTRVDGSFLPAVPIASAFGTCGVDLFFVISGFVMAHCISQGAPISATPFLWRRFKRIVPAFWLASAALILLRLAFGDPIAPEGLATTLSIVPLTGQNEYVFPTLYVGWTLAFEIGFYLMVAIVLATGCRRASIGVLGLAMAAGLLGTIWQPASITARFLINPIYLEFACGVAGQLLFSRRFFGRHARRALICLLGSFLAMFIVHQIDLGVSLRPLAVIDGDASLKRALIFGPAFMLLVLGSIEPERSASRLGQILLFIGRASYSLYLTHPLVMVAIGHAEFGAWHPNVYWLVAALTSGSILLGVLAHQFVERPLLHLLRRFDFRRVGDCELGSIGYCQSNLAAAQRDNRPRCVANP